MPRPKKHRAAARPEPIDPVARFERIARAAAMADLLHDYVRDGMDPADPDTIHSAVGILFDLLQPLGDFEGIVVPGETDDA